MGPKQIALTICGFIITGGFALITAAVKAVPYDWRVLAFGLALVLGGLSVALWLLFNKDKAKPDPKTEPTIMGDNNVNYGTNHGQIGSNHYHAAPSPRKLRRQDGLELMKYIDKDRMVSVETNMGDAEAIQLSNEIRNFLKAEGYETQVVIKMCIPPIPAGIGVPHKGGDNIIQIGANA